MMDRYEGLSASINVGRFLLSPQCEPPLRLEHFLLHLRRYFDGESKLKFVPPNKRGPIKRAYRTAFFWMRVRIVDSSDAGRELEGREFDARTREELRCRVWRRGRTRCSSVYNWELQV